jgi:CBS domain-containing protein
MVASQLPSLLELMNPAPPAIDPDDPLDVAEAAMRLVDASHLPVARNRTLLGIVSLRALLTDDDRPRRAGDLPPQPPIAAHPDSDVAEAAALLLRYRLSILPLVRDGNLVGSVTRADLVRMAARLLESDGSPVRALMTPSPVISVQADESLEHAATLMRHGLVRHLPVLRARRLCGLLVDHDVLAALHRRPRAKVSDIMQRSIETTAPDEDAAVAATQMLAAHVGALPVVDGARLVGMLAESDFLEYLVSHE